MYFSGTRVLIIVARCVTEGKREERDFANVNYTRCLSILLDLLINIENRFAAFFSLAFFLAEMRSNFFTFVTL